MQYSEIPATMQPFHNKHKLKKKKKKKTLILCKNLSNFFVTGCHEELTIN